MFDDLDKEMHEPVGKAQTQGEEMAFLQSFGKPWQLGQLLVEVEEKAKHVFVRNDEVGVRLGRAEKLINETVLEQVEFLWKVRARAAQSAGPLAFVGFSTRRSALDGAWQQWIKSGADEKSEPFDFCQSTERRTWTKIRLFYDQVKKAIDSLDPLVRRSLGIDDLLEIARRVLEVQRRLQLTRQPPGEPRVEQLIAGAKRDQALPNYRNDFVLVNPGEQVVPKKIIQFRPGGGCVDGGRICFPSGW
jgi:hypothetical protein